MIIRRSLLVLPVVAISLGAGLFATHLADDDRSLSVLVKNLPADAGGDDSVLVLQAIKVQDGTIVTRRREEAQGEFPIAVPVPRTHVLLKGTYLSLSSPSFYQGATGVYSDKDPVVTMANAANAPAPNAGSLPTYPPDRGKAIGYNSDKFTVSGTNAASWPKLGRGFADITVTDLVAKPCRGDGDGYVVVGTADPRTTALLMQEVNLQQRPEFDPAYRVTPHFIAPTHMVNGQIVLNGSSATVILTLQDMKSGTLATVSRTGPFHDLFDTIDGATTALSTEACKERPWKGTVTMEQVSSQHGENPDTRKPWTIERTSSMRCTVTGPDGEATCSASVKSKLAGSGAFLTSEGAGTDNAIVQVSLTPEKTVVEISAVHVKGTMMTDKGGGPDTFTVGPFTAEGPPTSDHMHVSGSWSPELTPEFLKMYDTVKMTITWDLSRQ